LNWPVVLAETVEILLVALPDKIFIYGGKLIMTVPRQLLAADSWAGRELNWVNYF